MTQHPPLKRSWSAPALIGLGVGGWLLYSLFNKAQAATPAGVPAAGAGAARANPYSPTALNASVPGVSFAPSTIQPGILTSTLIAVPAATSNQIAAANTFWSTLSPVVPLASGYVTFPSGAQAAAATFGGGTTALDGNGNLYVQWAGQVYQLGSQDSAGNYPALPVGATGATPSGGFSAATYPGVAPVVMDSNTSPNWLGI